jgi:hypothetical protein
MVHQSKMQNVIDVLCIFSYDIAGYSCENQTSALYDVEDFVFRHA